MSTAINASGTVVGNSSVSGDMTSHGFVWANGTMRDLGTLGGNWSDARAINAAGQVVGYADTAEGDPHAFLWEDGVMRDLGTLGGLLSTAAERSIDDSGRIVGTGETELGEIHGFVWERGVMRDIGIQGVPTTSPVALNAVGQVLLSSQTAGGRAGAFLYDLDSCLTEP